MLDINTPRGQESLAQELRAAEIIEATWLGCQYLHTPKEREADVDALIVHGGTLCAIALTSCRNMSRDHLMSQYQGKWLITYAKLVKAEIIAKALCVELWGFLYLIPDDMVLRIKLWSPARQWITPFSVAKTETQATINGGKAIRDNAYILMEHADKLKGVPVHRTTPSSHASTTCTDGPVHPHAV